VPEVNEAAADIEEVRAWAAGLEALHTRIGGRFARANHADGCWRICVACSARWGARMAGSWPSTPASAPRMACSGCWQRLTGIRIWSATTGAPRWSSTWAIRAGCWW
jgi:hypothetical protein